MKCVMLTALIGLLSTALLLDPQPVFADGCPNPVNDSVLHRLEHAKPVTLDYQTGQSVLLSGNEDGSADLAGHSVVGIEFEPSGQMIGYGVETLPPVDITPLLALGTNTVSLTAVDPQDTAWLRVIPPCSAAPQPVPTAAGHEAKLQPMPSPVPVPTATRVLIPTPTPAPTPEDAIVTQVPPHTHTDGIVDAKNEKAPVAGSHPATGGEALLRRLGRILLAMTLLALILLFAMSDPGYLRDGLVLLVDWCKRQEWGAALKRVMAMDAAQFVAWRKQQALWLRAKFSTVKADLPGQYHRLNWDALVARWNAVKAQILAWLKQIR